MKTKNINLIHDLVNCNWNFPEQRNGDGLYNLHPYPAKFISQIPKALIKIIGVPQKTVVFDPFCGYGTTLIAAQSLGHPSIGIDLNPIACLIARVSTQSCSQDFVESANRCIQKAKDTEGTISIPNIPNLDHWFKKPIQLAVLGLITAINEIEEDNIRDALRLALSSILVRVSNQDSDTRYAAIDKQIRKDDVYTLFYRVCQQYIQVLHTSQNYPNATVLNKNILEISPSNISKKIGLVISSPPYPAAYEYWLYHKYRMWWLGFDPLSVKEHEIGARSHFFKKDHHTPKDFENQMQKVFKLLSKICSPNSYACFVVGNSKIHGEIIDNTELLISAAMQENFELRTILPRNIPSNRKSFNLSNSRILTENIIILQK